jgi:hypothetical protein
MWNLISARLEIVFVSGDDRSTVCTKRTIGLDWMHLMVLLVHVAQVEAYFSPFSDCANLDARWVHSLCRMYHRLKNHFGRT